MDHDSRRPEPARPGRRAAAFPFASACAIALALIALWACQLTQSKKVETASFDQMYVKLSQFDHVVIVFQDTNGNLLDTVFAGKVDSHAKIHELRVDGWDGGKARIVISGYAGGVLVYRIEKKFDGTIDRVDANILILDPSTALSGDSRSLQMRAGDSMPLPEITVTPGNLADKSLSWKVSNPDLLGLGPNHVLAKGPGAGTLTAVLRSDTSKTFSITITIVPEGSSLDSTPPNKPVVQGPAAPSTARPTWTWSSGGGGGAGVFRFSLDADSFPKPETLDSSFTPAADLPDGPHTLYVQERDSAGNWSASGKATVVVSAPEPGAPIVKATPSGTTNNPRPVWSWKGSGSGLGFQFSLDSDGFSGAGGPVPDTSFVPSAPLSEGPHTLYVREKTAAGTWSPAGSATVAIDLTPPPVPKVNGTSPTNLAPKWTWSGEGGAGIFRFRLADSNFTASDKETRDTAYALASAASGTTYTLFVQERDAAGNWSGAGSKAIRYDLTRPVVSIVSPQASGTYYTSTAIAISGTATGPSPISKVAYRIGSGSPSNASFTAPNWNIPAPALQEGTPASITVTATDSTGNTGEAQLTLFLDTAPPSAPALTTVPAAAINAAKASFGWNPGGDGANGSGLNGRYRYNLNGGPWKDTTAALLSDLPLKEGTNVFNVQEQDKALLWSSSASHSFRVDTTPPVIVLTSHANPASSTSLGITLAGQVRDSGGTGVASMAVSGQASGSGTVTVTGTTWTTAALTLASGANTLVLTAVDQLGNDRSLSVVVNVNVPAPRVLITNPADSLTVTNQSSIVVTYTIDGGAAQMQTFSLPTDGIHRLVVSSQPNASGNVGRDTVKVTRDAAPPLSPTVTPGTTPTNGNATWTWMSRGDNAGGAGMRTPPLYRYSLNNGVTWTETSALQFQVGTEGSYALVVQEQDRAGNWSPSSTPQTIVVDKTAPTVAITSPTRDNYVTNQGTVLIQYRVNNGPVTQATCTLSVANGRNTCRARAEDSARNVGMDTISVWRRSNAVFVTQAGAGLGTGTDWENALSGSNLPAALENRNSEGRTYWLATGSYPVLTANYNVTLLGGFVAANFPYDPNSRQRDLTTITSFHCGNNVTATVEGVRADFFSGGTSPTLNLRDVTIIPPTTGDVFCAFFFQQSGSNITATNLVIENAYYTYSIFLLDGNLTLNGGSIRDNMTRDANPLLVDGVTNLNSPLIMRGNQSGSSSQGVYQIRVGATGRLTIGSGVALSCVEANGDVVIQPGGTCTKR